MSQLRDLALAAVAGLAGSPGDETAPEVARFVERWSFGEGEGRWAQEFVRRLQDPAEDDRSLVRLAAELGLAPIEVAAVALSAAVEDELLVGRAIARLQAPVGGSRPTVGLLALALAPLAHGGRGAVTALAGGRARGTGLLVLHGDGPLAERAVAVAEAVVFSLAGRSVPPPGVEPGEGMAQVDLAPSVVEFATRHARALGPGDALVIRARGAIEARAVAARVAVARDARVALLDRRPRAVVGGQGSGPGDPLGELPEGLGPWLVLEGRLPVFHLEPGPGERVRLPAIPGHEGPMVALLGPDGGVQPAAGPGVLVEWRLPVPGPDERGALWRHALGADAPDGLAEELGREHRHSSGRIALLARSARRAAAVRGGALGRGDVSRAAFSCDGDGLGALAEPLPDRVDDPSLVVPAGLRGDLDSLVERCRARDGLTDGLGQAARTRYRPGVRALLVGPSGTGKSLVAGWLATRLELPLYRVDLASVVSKYIGETERNLAQVLARAEEAEVVLLFDEADSMFGKRTEVREANDRFANAQTNYLLQRIETFDGIAVLTSNSRSRFDQAFSRRLDFVLELPAPSPRDRRRLWKAHLGELSAALALPELNRLAATAELTGGQIRNVVLAVAARARASGRGAGELGLDDFRQALDAEYRKVGKQLPAGLAPARPTIRVGESRAGGG